MLGAEILIAEGEIVVGGGDSNCGRGRLLLGAEIFRGRGRLLLGAEILIAEGGDCCWGRRF